jgi:hypothetical protein
MSPKNRVRLLCPAVIMALVCWLAMSGRVKPPAVGEVGKVTVSEPSRGAARPVESVPLQPKGEPVVIAPPSHAEPRVADQPVRVSDLDLQSRPLQKVQLMLPRVAADVSLLPGFVGPAEWRNLGTATASAAFETHCWAIDHGNADVLLSTVDLSDESRTKLKLIFDRLPAADREKYGSPERMMGMIWVYHGLPFAGFMIESEVPHSPEETGVLLQLQYGQNGTGREFVFKHAADGWRKLTPAQQVDNFLRMSGISPSGSP